MTMARRRRWVCLLGGSLALGLLPGCTSAVAGTPSGYDLVLSSLLSALIFLANLAGGLVVGIATVRALVLFVRDLLQRRGGEVPKEAIRLSLGRSLALALEFQLGADILGTAVNPSLQDIATLAAIAVLRTALNYFLGRELRDAESRDSGRSVT